MSTYEGGRDPRISGNPEKPGKWPFWPKKSPKTPQNAALFAKNALFYTYFPGFWTPKSGFLEVLGIPKTPGNLPPIYRDRFPGISRNPGTPKIDSNLGSKIDPKFQSILGTPPGNLQKIVGSKITPLPLYRCKKCNIVMATAYF
jgi:hypothetical protein